MDSNNNSLSVVPSVPVSTPGRVDPDLPLTLQEIGFLENYFVSPYSPQTEELTIDQAMILAGYDYVTQSTRGKWAQKILRKYELGAGDSQKIFCDIGLGQAQIARGVKHKAENAISEMVALNALKLAAQCTRMVEEPQASHQGVNIIINCGTEPTGGPGAPARPVNVSIQGEALPAKPMQITK